MFTNESLNEHRSKLSADRWLQLHINSDFSIKFHKENIDGTISPVRLLDLEVKK